MGTNQTNLRNQMFQKLCALIPNQINNKTIVQVMDLMRKQQRFMGKHYVSHLALNTENMKKHADSILQYHGFIEDQNNYEDLLFGEATLKYSGCEIISVFNALNNLGAKRIVTIPGLISHFEKDGMIFSGKFGTAPTALQDYFKANGYETVFTTKEQEFASIGANYKTFILTMYNDRNDISKEVHTINISKENTMYTIHNAYGNGIVLGPFNSIPAAIKNINNGKAKGISLIGIR